MNVFIVKILVAIDYDALILKYRKLAIVFHKEKIYEVVRIK